MAAVAPVAGNMINRYGARLLLCGGLVAIAPGMGLSSTMQAPWQFLVGFGGLAGLGFGMAATHADAAGVLASAVTLAKTSC
jgi:hypothetical protein